MHFILQIKDRLFFLGVIMSLMGLSSQAQATTFNVISTGQVNTVIVLPQSPVAVLDYAATELQDHIEKISGVKPEIVSEDDLHNYPDKAQLHLGKTSAAIKQQLYDSPLPANAYKLFVADNKMFIAGNDTEGEALSSMTGAGTLFGIYDLLEKQHNVRWLWPGEIGTQIPRSDTVTFIVGDNNAVHLQAKNFSLWRAAHASGAVGRNLDFWQSKEAGEKYYVEQAKWLRRHRFGIGTVTRLIHTDTRVFHSFLDYWKKYGEEHPEYFNLLPDGTRREHPGRGRGGPGTTLCVSNPALWKQIVDDWRNSWRGRMGAHILVGENDSPALCTCEGCRSWDAPDPRFETSEYWGKGRMFETITPFLINDVVGNSVKWGWHGKLEADPAPSLSDRYARFYLEVQREAEKTHPGAVVAGFAYLNYWQAPKNPIQLNDRIIISFVPPTRVPYTKELSDEIRKNWDGWRKTGAQVYLRPNFPTSHNAPMAFANRFSEDLKYFGENGLIGSDYDSLNRGHFGTQGTSLYAVARSNTHPGLAGEQILDEYYSAFGPASQTVERYFEFWEGVSEKEVSIGHQKDMTGIVGDEEAQSDPLIEVASWIKLYHQTFTPEIIQQGRHLIENIKKNAGNDRTVLQRVSYLDNAYRDVELTAKVINTFVSYHQRGKKDESLKQQFKLQHDELMEHRRKLETQNIGDYGARQSAENHAFRSIRE